MNTNSSNNDALQLWGGIECTLNRVGGDFFDQISRSGHELRVDDLDRFANLGIRAMRYPLLWERIAPRGLESADFRWSDQRLNRLRELGVRPIAGLVHHGSGPRFTSLVDPAFPVKLAEYARTVAERYPWIDDYTPVNEPLTTARFSGLYGHWYPHGCDELTFARAFLIQCKAIILSMREIRAVNSSARLIQTEDLGKTFSTRHLAYQADFENERRWLTFDLLLGRIDQDHRMWEYLREAGITSHELSWFLDNPCPPDILGINHYVTSERFLDERMGHYPLRTHGGNGYDAYADLEAVRVCAEGPSGPKKILGEAWQRYELPMAVTEAHLGCTRDEQMRWFKEVWESAQSLRNDGADIRAVTAWSLLGAFDWSSLLTIANDDYEPGVFDIRGPEPRPTAIAGLLRSLATGETPDHPVLDSPGWWRRDVRYLYSPVGRPKLGPPVFESRPLLITGATGTLGKAFARICEARGLAYQLLNRQQMDIAEPDSVMRAFEEYQPWAVVNAAGFVRVDQAETETAVCRRENIDGPATLAEACRKFDVSFVTFSSDLVFDGQKRAPYLENDALAPLNAYGKSKAGAERLVMEKHPASLVVRTSAFFGPWDGFNFLAGVFRSLAAGAKSSAPTDSIVSPTYVPDLVNASLDLLIDGERGIWHLANPGAVSWLEFARMAASLAGFNPSAIEPCTTASLNLRAQRPVYSVLGSERGVLLPSLENALVRFLEECESLAPRTREFSVAS